VGAVTRTILALAATVGLGTVAVVASPFRAVTPGPLRQGHARLRDDCFSCHAPFAGATRERCVRCHQPAAIGERTVDGRPRLAAARRPALRGLHTAIAGAACQRCHVEHGGRTVAGATTRFGHDVLPAATRAECASCHAGRRPPDALHAQAVASCGGCHGTEAWKPARYDHDRLFRFDGNHPPRCADCHDSSGDWRRYDCTRCHEHSRSRMIAEHREVRTPNLDDCARCHRSGNEHERAGREGGGSGRGERRAEEDDD
jgi:hypothetical protein